MEKMQSALMVTKPNYIIFMYLYMCASTHFCFSLLARSNLVYIVPLCVHLSVKHILKKTKKKKKLNEIH